MAFRYFRIRTSLNAVAIHCKTRQTPVVNTIPGHRLRATNRGLHIGETISAFKGPGREYQKAAEARPFLCRIEADVFRALEQETNRTLQAYS